MAAGTLGWRNGRDEGPDFEVRTVFDLLDVVQRKPALFLGEHSLSALYWFLQGYGSAMHAHQLEFEVAEPGFGGFHDFVAAHYGWSESTAGWRNIILKECGGDEQAALDGFFSLLAAFRGRA